MRFRIFTEPQEGATYDDQLAVARLAEELGFDAYFRSDHYISFTFGDGLPGPTDAWITLAGLARDTTTLRLGTLVSPVTFRLPGPLAIAVAQIDAMSGGRVELGLGAGWNDREHAAYGIPFPPTGVRFDMLEDQLTIIRGLWSTPVGEHFSYSGSQHSVDDSPGLPKPVQQPGPPIVMGGFGAKRTPALAARFADEFNMPPFEGLDATRAAFERVRAACNTIGRDPGTLDLSVTLTTVCGRDHDELERRGAVSPAQFEAADLRGNPDELVEQLAHWADLGATRAYLRILDLLDVAQIELLRDVVAAVASTSTRHPIIT